MLNIPPSTSPIFSGIPCDVYKPRTVCCSYVLALCRVSGEHPVTCHNMGMSYFYLGKLKKAKAFFERSLELDPVGTHSPS